MSDERYIEHFLVDSKFRLDGSDSNFHYRIETDPSKHYTRITVAQIVIPATYYQITNENNTFTLTENTLQYIIEMPIGNYTKESMIAQLQTQMNNAGANTYTVVARNTAIEPEDNRFTYTFTGAQVPVFISDLSIKLGELMGLSTNVSHQLPMTSDKAYSFAAEQTLLLYSDAVSDKQPLSISLDNGIGGGTLSRSSFDYMADSRPLRISRGNVYNFRLANEDNQNIDLNGQNMSIEIILF